MSEPDDLPGRKGCRGRHEVWVLTFSHPGRGGGTPAAAVERDHLGSA